jgi:hypothetical protein
MIHAILVLFGAPITRSRNIFKPQDLRSLETNHLLQSYPEDISLGAVDIDCHSLYASSGPGYSYA